MAASTTHEALTFDDDDLAKGNQLMFLFLTSEKLLGNSRVLGSLIDLDSMKKLTASIVDEAHCVSLCGHDFRPEYQHLGILKDQFPAVPIMAFPATATPDVKREITSVLHIPKCMAFQNSFNRPNLTFSVIAKLSGAGCFQQVNGFIRKHRFKDKCGVIFCMTTAETETMSEWLKHRGLSTEFYHTKMSINERNEVQKHWMTNRVRVIVATVAFGMGIDKPDVCFVIHFTMPKSIKAYTKRADAQAAMGSGTFACSSIRRTTTAASGAYSLRTAPATR
jgi:bloom syndrome protein